MYRLLGTVRLNTGETMECVVVEAPAPDWAPRIEPFLAHKLPQWRFHIAESLRRPLGGLATRFYLGLLGGAPITAVMVAAARGVGLLGYVYTAPEHRRKGAYSQLMGLQMADCRARGLRILELTTAFDSPAYWIYHRHGFRSIDGSSGGMTWLADPGAGRDWFRPGVTTVHPLDWGDWPVLNFTALRLPSPGEDLPRSTAFPLLDYGTVEGKFATLYPEWTRASKARALTLRSEHGAVAGWAILKPDELTFGAADVLDLYVHPAFRADARTLLDAVPWPAGRRVVAYTTPASGFRAGLLRDCGFAPAATLPRWLLGGSGLVDLHVLARDP